MTIILDLVVQGFDITVGTIVVGLAISRITVFQPERMYTPPTQNCDIMIIKVDYMYVIKEDLIVEVGGTIYFGEARHIHEPAVSVCPSKQADFFRQSSFMGML